MLPPSPSFSLIFLLLYLLSASCYGQQSNFQREQRLEELAERMAATEEASTESSLLLDDLTQFSTRPIFINTASEEELVRLNLLNFSQVRSLLKYREKYGKILTGNELAVLEGFSESDVEKIVPYLRFDPEPDSLTRLRRMTVHQLLLLRVKTTFPVAAGYTSRGGKPPVYNGVPYNIYTRYRGEVGKWLEIGMTGENDAGEDFFQNSNKRGFDFLSGYAGWNGKGFLRKIVAGDYHLRFGQGINLWSGGGVSYASDIFSLMRTGEGIRPYSSSDENLFFRGAAIRFAIKPVQVSLFYSDKNRDANVETDSMGHEFITSFRLDGLHRTFTELSDEKNCRERLAGGYGDFRFDKWRVGLLASFRTFELPVVKGELPYKSNAFEGDISSNWGMDYQAVFNRVSLFGEAGMTRHLNWAVVNGLLWKAHPRFSLSFLYRYYDPAFQSFNSAAFAEGSGSRNEKGFFAACEFNPAPHVKVTGLSDLFYFPWLTYQTYSPSRGYNISFRAEVALRRDALVYLFTKYLQQPAKISGVTGIPEQWDEKITKWRVHGEFGIHERIRLRSRMEFTWYNFTDRKEKGFLVYQDMIFTAARKLKCWMRLSWYRTDGYDSRIYSYENDLLYYFSIPEFHGKGMRSYLNLKLEPVRGISIYAKMGYTLRSKESSLGTGNDATPGDHRWDIRGQVALKF